MRTNMKEKTKGRKEPGTNEGGNERRMKTGYEKVKDKQEKRMQDRMRM
jgi:hypothetical protein